MFRQLLEGIDVPAVAALIVDSWTGKIVARRTVATDVSLAADLLDGNCFLILLEDR